MNEKVTENMQTNPNDNYLNIKDCRLITTNNINSKNTIALSSPENDFLIIYFAEARGYFECDNSKIMLKNGDLIFAEPNSQFNCKIETSSNYYLMQFSGNASKEIISSVGLSKTGVYSVGYSTKIINLFCDMIFSLSINSPVLNLHCNSIFFEILNLVSKQILSINKSDYAYEKKLTPAINHMKLYYFENHPLEFYASLCNMSLSYFKHSFQQSTLVPPLTYLNTIRLENAKHLLVATQMTVSEVAVSVGFNDPKYFSRLFKKYVGVTPFQFYKENFKI